MSEIDWSKAPEYCDQAYTTGPAWDGGSRHKGEIRFARINSFGSPQSSCGAILDIGERSWVLVESRPSHAWSGEGLPPVGIECDCGSFSKHDPEPLPQWKEGDKIKCVAHIEIPGSESLPLFWNARTFSASTLASHCYRPIRTPEQIAGDEQKSEISFMASCIAHSNCRHAPTDHDIAAAEHLHYLGYRKP